MSLGAFWVLVILGAIVAPLILELVWMVLLLILGLIMTVADTVRGRRT